MYLLVLYIGCFCTGCFLGNFKVLVVLLAVLTLFLAGLYDWLASHMPRTVIYDMPVTAVVISLGYMVGMIVNPVLKKVLGSKG